MKSIHDGGMQDCLSWGGMKLNIVCVTRHVLRFSRQHDQTGLGSIQHIVVVDVLMSFSCVSVFLYLNVDCHWVYWRFRFNP